MALLVVVGLTVGVVGGCGVGLLGVVQVFLLKKQKGSQRGQHLLKVRFASSAASSRLARPVLEAATGAVVAAVTAKLVYRVAVCSPPPLASMPEGPLATVGAAAMAAKSSCCGAGEAKATAARAALARTILLIPIVSEKESIARRSDSECE